MAKILLLTNRLYNNDIFWLKFVLVQERTLSWKIKISYFQTEIYVVFVSTNKKQNKKNDANTCNMTSMSCLQACQRSLLHCLCFIWNHFIVFLFASICVFCHIFILVRLVMFIQEKWIHAVELHLSSHFSSVLRIPSFIILCCFVIHFIIFSNLNPVFRDDVVKIWKYSN